MPHKVDSISYWKKMVFLLGFFKIPMVFYVRPQILQVDSSTVKLKIKIRRRTKNHLKSMYFGALAVGADIAGGIHAFYFSEKLGGKVSFAFKDMKATFHKRAESDVTFVCNDGHIVEAAVNKSKSSGERVNETVKVEAFNTDNEVVATFEMGVSVKVK